MANYTIKNFIDRNLLRWIKHHDGIAYIDDVFGPIKDIIDIGNGQYRIEPQHIEVSENEILHVIWRYQPQYDNRQRHK